MLNYCPIHVKINFFALFIGIFVLISVFFNEYDVIED